MENTIAKEPSATLGWTISPLAGIAVLLTIQMSALWPVWAWYVHRIYDKSDEPYGLMALATIIVLLIGERASIARPLSTRTLIGASTLMAAYALTSIYCPMLFSACFAMVALAIIVSSVFFSKPFYLPILGLALLSLPMVASLQFYAGFPLRAGCTESAALLLRLSGYRVLAQGTGLIWNGHYIGIDAACSGVKLLWAAMYTGLTLASIMRLSNRGTVYLCLLAFTSAIIGNVFRATSLFFIEVFPLRLLPFNIPSWCHEGTGIIVFVFMATSIAFASKQIARHYSEQTKQSATTNNCRTALTLFLGSCLAAGLIPLASTQLAGSNKDSDSATISQIQAVPLFFEGRSVRPIALNAQESTFLSLFPGQITKLTDGRKQIVIRTLTKPTRQLHPSEDCFKGLGYTIHPLAAGTDTQGNLWGRFEAGKGTTRLLVRERIYDDSGNSWTDVSAWYWATLLGKSKAPWTAVTVAESFPDFR